MRSFACVLTLGVALAPSLAAADGLVIPGLGPDDPRPGYREAAFPPPQHDLFGLPERMPQPSDRPSYRQASQYPPPGGRYGGGFIEYIMTGGRPEPVPPPAYAAPPSAAPVSAGLALPDLFAPGDAAPAYQASAAVNPMRARLPSTAASSARVHQCVDRLPSSCTSQGTQPSFPAAGPLA